MHLSLNLEILSGYPESAAGALRKLLPEIFEANLHLEVNRSTQALE